MMQFFIVYAVALPVCLVLDYLWIGIVAKNFYQRELAEFLSPTVHFGVAGMYYAIFVFGLTILVILPALRSGSALSALLLGLLFGLCVYAAYDLVNLATIRNWPVLASIVDMAWGTFVGGAVAISTYAIVSRFFW